jgi:hypothetical protein
MMAKRETKILAKKCNCEQKAKCKTTSATSGFYTAFLRVNRGGAWLLADLQGDSSDVDRDRE